MILLCGIPSEPPVAMVGDELRAAGAEVVFFNQRRFAEMELELELVDGSVAGELRIRGDHYLLAGFSGVYTRLMDDQLVPELEAESAGSPARLRARALTEVLTSWYEIAPCRVVNRSRPQGSNFSKPYQAQLIRAAGFLIPETLITNDPELAHEFIARHGRVIYKSISGVRSIVREVTAADVARLESIRWCPVQFQVYVPGTDVRVHVVDAEVFATEIQSDATDYRYGSRLTGKAAQLSPTELPDEVGQRCVEIARRLGLPLSGLDLRINEGGEVFCFEVNPSPAFSYYEAHAGQLMARAVARYLVGG